MLNLPPFDRPRERLATCGPEALTTAELLAVILGSGTRGKSVLQLAQELIAHFGGLDGLSEASLEELCELKGLGKAKALQLKAALTLSTRLGLKGDQKVKIRNPEHAYQLVRSALEGRSEECFLVLLQDAKGCVIRQEMIATGTLTQVSVDPRQVFHPAIRHKAAAVVVAHNHPSGDPTPSPEDISLTRLLIEAGKTLGIPLNDHLIIGNQGFTSLRQALKWGGG